MLEFRILGPLDVLQDGRPVALGGPKQRAALAILLLSANRVVSIERFADDLYAGEPPVTAVTQVQRQVSELRKLLGASVIETRSPGYALRAEHEQLDLDRFERWTHEAAQACRGGRRNCGRPARPRTRALARSTARRPCVRAVRPDVDHPPRGTAARGAGTARRREAPAR